VRVYEKYSTRGCREVRPTFINTLFPVHRPHLFLGPASVFIMYFIFINTIKLLSCDEIFSLLSVSELKADWFESDLLAKWFENVMETSAIQYVAWYSCLVYSFIKCQCNNEFSSNNDNNHPPSSVCCLIQDRKQGIDKCWPYTAWGECCIASIHPLSAVFFIHTS